MDYKSKSLCKIRTITSFLVLDSDRSAWPLVIKRAVDFCLSLSAQFVNNGYQVQSMRIVTNPFGEYLNTNNIDSAKVDLAYISEILNSANASPLRIRFAIGEATTPHEIALLPELIQCYGDLCNACVNISMDDQDVLDNVLIEQAAKTVINISRMTLRGEGNFNFTVNFNCKPLIPYFPASFHQKKLGNLYVLGLETPDLLMHVLHEFNEVNIFLDHQHRFKNYYRLMREALQYHVDLIKKINDDFMATHSSDFVFAGLDSSAAPSKNCTSMVEIYKQLGVDYFGAAGTVEASSLLTRVFKSIKGMPLVGFSGLMLAVTEDEGLAQGSIDADYDIRTLLTNSAVCGIGLDTVPIPGDTSIDKISALMRDTGTLAFRLNKPLTVRLFPVPTCKRVN
ncbi:DUF711 family protein [Psychromonas sp. MME2]|uniref:DUF711 family protein n=1 Tax=unclassified Psychromonas TaxID=2614957 RepID=UPI00339CA8DA